MRLPTRGVRRAGPGPGARRLARAHPARAAPFDLVASDVDGTLLTSSHALAPAVAAAVAACEREAGVPLVLATGKAPAGPWAAPLAAALGGGRRAGVFLQGAVVLDAEGRELYAAVLDGDVAHAAQALADALDVALAVYCSDAATGTHRVLVTRADAHTGRLAAYGEPPPEVAPGGDAAAEAARRGLRVHKAIWLGPDAAVADARAAAGQLLAGFADLTSALPGMAECLPAGVNKGEGLLRLLAESSAAGVDPARLLFIGDGENDVEALCLAGTGVAVGNACALARGAADVVLEETNDEDAVAVALARFVLEPAGVAAPRA